MELTDAIRNKYFKYVLDTHLWKTSIEYTSLAALKFCYPEKYKTLRKVEAPDLQDFENGTAIEITDSVTSTDAQTAGEFVKLGLAKTEKDKEKCRKKIERNGSKLLMDGVMFWPSINPEKEKTEIVAAFIRKLKKVPEYRQKGFEKIGLLIYHEKPPFDNTLDECVMWLSQAQENSQHKFDFVYLLHTEGLLFCDFSDDTTEHIKISHNDREALGNLGRMAAEGEITNDDPIWQ